MQMKEVCIKTNLTKKAIEYYIDRNLVHPTLLENGYRDFSKKDIETLTKISIYRKLDLSISDIEILLEDKAKLNEIICKHKIKMDHKQRKLALLEKLNQGESLENIQKEIQLLSSRTTVLEKLQDIFPGYIGQLFTLNFHFYLQNEIENATQKEALDTIIEWIDHTEPLQLSENEKALLETYSTLMNVEDMQQIIHTKQENVTHFESFLQENKEIIKQYMEYKESDAYKKTDAYVIQQLLKKFCENSGYNEIFIPAMRKLSPSYESYYQKLLYADDMLKKELHLE